MSLSRAEHVFSSRMARRMLTYASMTRPYLKYVVNEESHLRPDGPHVPTALPERPPSLPGVCTLPARASRTPKPPLRLTLVHLLHTYDLYTLEEDHPENQPGVILSV